MDGLERRAWVRQRAGLFGGMLLAAAGAVACTGVIGTPPGEGAKGAPGSPGSPGGPSGPNASGAGANGAGAGPGGSSPTAASPQKPFAQCETNVTTAGPAPLARLTTVEYRNTLQDLFPGVALGLDDVTLPAEIATEGFTNNSETQTPSAALIEALSKNAHTVALAATADTSKILPCAPASPSEEADCGRQFLADLGGRAFRGAFGDAESTRYGEFFESARGQWGFRSALQLSVEAMLQSPDFLYRIEVGESAAAGAAVALTSRELASRLAYFLTDTAPDAALLDAVSRDALTEVTAVEQEARRLLGDDRARAAVAEFNGQWLRFDKMSALAKAPDLFPSFSATMAASMRQATARYVDHLFWDDGQTLEALLTDDHAFVDDQLAPLYGVAAPGAALSLVDVDASRRSGILTQAGLLAGFAHERSDAPVLRGVFVLDRLLCKTPPPPPKGVITALPVLEPSAHLTTRQQLETSHVASECVTCHDSIDGIGFGFGNYDALGQWRTTEFGVPVDSHGELRGTDVDGPFEGAVELGEKLSESGQVRRCVSTQVLRYALGVTRQKVDACMVQSIVNGFEASGHDLRELLVSVVTSDAFRYRKAE